MVAKSALNTFRYPSTRYTGSKRKFLEWIKENSDLLKFDTVLDVFGGTGSISLMFKRYGKRVSYNDILVSNQIIAKAVIENDSVTVEQAELDRIFQKKQSKYPSFIQDNFSGMFFMDTENALLDMLVTNIRCVKNEYKRSILLASLFQACLAKRPFNLFHRANLNLRTNNVKRTFSNKTTWERSFYELMSRYTSEYNRAVFSNGKLNRVVGGYDAVKSPNGVDLVYMDPPYFSDHMSQGTNYLSYYHFLEGLADYENWNKHEFHNKSKCMEDSDGITNFVKKDRIRQSFQKLINRFKHTQIVLSYQSNGVPTKEEIIDMLTVAGKKVKVFEKTHKYALSKKETKELLFVAK